jgi:hypothetical protein
MKFHPIIVAAITASVPCVVLVAISVGEMAPSIPSSYCNPVQLPDYSVGRWARDHTKGDPAEANGLWLIDRKEQFRELADPSALWHEERWFLYPSVKMAWVGEDEGRPNRS